MFYILLHVLRQILFHTLRTAPVRVLRPLLIILLLFLSLFATVPHHCLLAQDLSQLQELPYQQPLHTLLAVDSTDKADSASAARSGTAISTSIDPWKLGSIGAISAGAVAYSTIFFSKEWWRDYPAPFHVNTDDDYRYALNADKLGHFMTPFALRAVYQQAFEWSGMQPEQSLWWSSGLALAFQTYMEIRDGFSKYGFSWGDCAANVLGAAFPVAQYHVPALRHLKPKISFYPSEQLLAGKYRVIIDDYESTYHWLSINVHGFLPEEAQRWYPPWLAVAVGHSVKQLDDVGGGQHELYIALDWNLEGLPDCGWLCDVLKKNFNLYKLPAPAIRVLPTVVWYGLKF